MNVRTTTDHCAGPPMHETFAALYFLWSGSESMPIMYVLASARGYIVIIDEPVEKSFGSQSTASTYEATSTVM